MKVELSKKPKAGEVKFKYPCLLKRGQEVILASDDFSAGIIIESPDLLTGECTNECGNWAENDWVLFEGTVTLSNK